MGGEGGEEFVQAGRQREKGFVCVHVCVGACVRVCVCVGGGGECTVHHAPL